MLGVSLRLSLDVAGAAVEAVDDGPQVDMGCVNRHPQCVMWAEKVREVPAPAGARPPPAYTLAQGSTARTLHVRQRTGSRTCSQLAVEPSLQSLANPAIHEPIGYERGNKVKRR